jgi:hypothetical protein
MMSSRSLISGGMSGYVWVCMEAVSLVEGLG